MSKSNSLSYRSSSHHHTSHHSLQHSPSRLQHRSSHRSPSRSYDQSPRRSSSRYYGQPSQHLSFNSQEIINNQQEECPSFHVPSSVYELIFINHNTTTSTLDKLLDHVYHCRQYSIDTESEKKNNKLAVIQINTIPTNPPSIVMLCELKYFPDQDSHKYKKIYELFRLIFRANNEVYTWGKMELELESAQELLTWPIPAILIDLQPYFNIWYTWARTQCKVQCLINEDGNINGDGIERHHDQSISCRCHLPSPYRINELWSLQMAFKYRFNLFIDKSCRLSNWSASLSSDRSSLSKAQQREMIHYATHDVMAVTYLIRPITENWPFQRVRNRRINEVFTAFQSTKLPSLTSSLSKKKKKKKNINLNAFSKSITNDDANSNSDSEIYMNQLIDPDEHKPEHYNNNDDNKRNNYKINLSQLEYQPSDANANDNESIELKQQQPGPEAYESIELKQQQPGPEAYESIELKQQQPGPEAHEVIDVNYIAISDDDELLEQIQQPEQVHFNPTDIDLILHVNPDEAIEQSPQQNVPVEDTPVKLGRSRRSSQWKKKNNKKRNETKKKHRYRHSIIFGYYDKFPMYLIRKILRFYNIQFTHAKENKEKQLVIGLKNYESKQDAERKLSSNMFNRQGYFYYRRRFCQ